MKRTSECLLRFAIQNPGWHTLCNATKGAMGAMYYLEQAGFLEIMRYPNSPMRQFRLNRPEEPGHLGEPFDAKQLSTHEQREQVGRNVVSLQTFRHGQRDSRDE